MKLWNRKWARYGILAVLIVASAATISQARHFFRFWWFRPPAPAIEDVLFDDGLIAFANLRSIAITRGVGITQNVRATLIPDNDPDFVAAVEDGVLSFAGGLDTADPTMIDPSLPILLSSSSSTAVDANTTADTTTNVEITLNPTELRGFFFSSTFRASGVAVVDIEVVTTDLTDPANPVVTTTNSASVVPVTLFGNIHQHSASGVYHVRGSLRGFQRERDGSDLTYTFLNMYLSAEAPIP